MTLFLTKKVEIFAAKNTHFVAFRQRNADFRVALSFFLNTGIYIVYTIVYLIGPESTIRESPHKKKVTYANFGFGHSILGDLMLFLMGYIILLIINTILAALTRYWRAQERRVYEIYETNNIDVQVKF